MDKKLMELIKKEDIKKPYSDEQIASLLFISRQAVNRLRQKLGIPSRNKRREPFLKKDIKLLIENEPDISDRELTKRLQEIGYDISKFLVSSYRKELTVEKKTPINKVNASLFDSIIGSKGSIQSQIKKAEAAVLYPPNGLHTLIIGETGTGKTLLAEAMYQLAVSKGIVKEGKFVRFNCADYFNNPQLLVSHLFGHVKGAFTGAESNKTGLVESANGGILFLDEIHRLPLEGQEMLFSIIDKGCYRKLGESEREHKISLMIIGATTEDIKSSLALTFTRRMPMVIELPPIRQRGINERYELIKKFFKNESDRIGVGLRISSEVICALLLYNCIGNIGQLRSDIQVACARAYIRYLDFKDDMMKIALFDFDEHVQEGFIRKKYAARELIQYMDKSIQILPGQLHEEIIDENDQFLMPNAIYEFIEERHKELVNQNLTYPVIREIIGNELETKLKMTFRYFESVGSKLKRQEIIKSVGEELFSVVEGMVQIAKQKINALNDELIYYLALHFKQTYDRIKYGKPIINLTLQQIKEDIPYEFSIAKDMLNFAENKLNIRIPEEEAGYIAIYLNLNNTSKVKNDTKVKIIIVSHGYVALEMAKMANSIIGETFVESVCINLEAPSRIALRETLELAQRIDEGKGILFLADMGVATKFGDIVTKELGIKTKTISHVHSAMVLDAAFKALYNDITLEELYNSFINKKIEQEHIPKKRVIISLCLTGKGAALEIKKFITVAIPEIATFDIEIVPLAMMQNDLGYMIKMLKMRNDIIGIIGTVDPQNKEIPFIPVSNIFNEQGITAIKALIKKSILFLDENDNFNAMENLLSRELIFIEYEAKTKEQLLKELSVRLQKLGYVKEGFYQSMLDRENIGGTFNNGFAFPHAWPEFVKKPVIVVCTLKKPIKWDDDNYVDVVILLAFKVASNLLVKRIYNLVSNNETNKKLKKAKTKEQIIELFLNNQQIN